MTMPANPPDFRFETGDEAARFLSSEYVKDLWNENQRLKKIISRALAEFPLPPYYGPGSLWSEMIEAQDDGGEHDG